ncbi:MAG: hypothetical protein U0166_29395 [Acidobacteriota bacterium]
MTAPEKPKELMPEVLPDPRERSAPADGDPRERTRKRLAKLRDRNEATDPPPTKKA